jgi:hypothetical protein
LPYAWELDRAGGGRPVVVNSFELHTLSCSSAALEAAAIDADRSDPPHGTIVRCDGHPTGVLLEEAAQWVRDVIPARSSGQYRSDVLRGIEDLRRYGYVEIHEMRAEVRLAEVLTTLEKQGVSLPLCRLYAPRAHLSEVWRVVSEADSRKVVFGGLKLFADGTLSGRTALMCAPYGDPCESTDNGRAPDEGRKDRVQGASERTNGRFMFAAGELEALFAEAGRTGYGVAVHALGDGAVRRTLDAYQRVGACPTEAGFPLRIEHAQFIAPEDIDRFAQMEVIASLQPCHLLVDEQVMRRTVGDRLTRAFPLRDLVQAYRRAGLPVERYLLLGSDTPVVRPDPLDNVQAAVYRRRSDQDSGQAVSLHQAISEDLCWRLMQAPTVD